ncbi:hypothetical protein HHK36_015799 [Tetracentron sinense]|uniref:Protein kinase domain-containing protein n=1 Tax=Tetracentron sinense TaxID=13715 RepID=A0A835DDZ9_TETSI|nr:hypothetical protein HHK36_015799 [Tetracentron sinense]
MAMAVLLSKLYLRALAFFILVLVLAHGQNLLSCDTYLPDASGYRYNGSKSQDQCRTFAMFRTNSYYSSLFNLSFYLGLDRSVIADASGFSSDAEFLPKDQPLLIPIDCNCSEGFFRAEVTKITVKGESFYGIAESLEGLTTCKAIQEKNPSVSPWGLEDKVRLLIPLRCACPSPSELSQGIKFLLSYPISEDDTVSNLACKFNTTREAIISANNRSGTFKPESLVPVSSVLIPLNNKPILGPPSNPSEPNSDLPNCSRRSTLWKIGVYIALGGVLVGAIPAVATAILVIQWRRKQNFCKTGDMELQQLSLSVRTTSEKKVSFGESQNPLDDQIIDTSPQKMLVETYTVEELRKATEDFSSSNLIEGSVFHGRLNGKNLAIKSTKPGIISKIDFGLFHDAFHHHPNIIRLVGTCLIDGPDSFLVLEYAKNGSLKDWLHGGLAMKNQFISSCYCFLTWNQRLRISLDVAMALQYMHHTMKPSYVHRNIKSRNIFLDEEFNAKIGNFGMAKCGEDHIEDPQSLSTHPASWNKGYLAPEYLRHSIVSSSIDIFAYGVVLLEILSGKTPIMQADEKGEGIVLLSVKFKSILKSDDPEVLKDWMDRALGENYSFDAAVTLANLARACVEEEPSSRPSAGEIVDKLSRLVEELEGEQITSCERSSKPQFKGASSINQTRINNSSAIQGNLQS